MITIVIASRKSGNLNSALLKFLRSAAAQAEHLSNYEVLVKFDDDDEGREKVIGTLQRQKKFTNVRWIVTPRAGGYVDLHKAYNDLLLSFNPQTQLVWVVADDCLICLPGWDRFLIDLYEKTVNELGSQLFVLHQKYVDLHHLSLAQAIDSPDPFPIWTRNWVDLLGGFGPVAFTDAWTTCIEHFMIHEFGCDRRVALSPRVIERTVNPKLDTAAGERWSGVRADLHRSLLSERTAQTVGALARSAYVGTLYDGMSDAQKKAVGAVFRNSNMRLSKAGKIMKASGQRRN